MYITAHRIQDTATNASTIHTFVHVHDNKDLFSRKMQDIELLRQVTEVDPGRLVDKDVTFRTGGNRVLSYVDVIAPDTTPHDVIVAALQHFRNHGHGTGMLNYVRYDQVLVSFGAVFGLGDLETREYDQLCESLKGILHRFYTNRKP